MQKDHILSQDHEEKVFICDIVTVVLNDSILASDFFHRRKRQAYNQDNHHYITITQKIVLDVKLLLTILKHPPYTPIHPTSICIKQSIHPDKAISSLRTENLY